MNVHHHFSLSKVQNNVERTEAALQLSSNQNKK